MAEVSRWMLSVTLVALETLNKEAKGGRVDRTCIVEYLTPKVMEAAKSDSTLTIASIEHAITFLVENGYLSVNPGGDLMSEYAGDEIMRKLKSRPYFATLKVDPTLELTDAQKVYHEQRTANGGGNMATVFRKNGEIELRDERTLLEKVLRKKIAPYDNDGELRGDVEFRDDVAYPKGESTVVQMGNLSTWLCRITLVAKHTLSKTVAKHVIIDRRCVVEHLRPKVEEAAKYDSTLSATSVENAIDFFLEHDYLSEMSQGVGDLFMEKKGDDLLKQLRKLRDYYKLEVAPTFELTREGQAFEDQKVANGGGPLCTAFIDGEPVLLDEQKVLGLLFRQ